MYCDLSVTKLRENEWTDCLFLVDKMIRSNWRRCGSNRSSFERCDWTDAIVFFCTFRDGSRLVDVNMTRTNLDSTTFSGTLPFEGFILIWQADLTHEFVWIVSAACPF